MESNQHRRMRRATVSPICPVARRVITASTVVLTVVTSAFLAGCGGGSGAFFQEPDAELEDARLTDLNFETMDLELDFVVDNPNGYDLPISNIGWTLMVWDEPFADGIANVEEPLVAEGSSDLTVPVTLQLDDVAAGVEMLFDGEPIPYLVEGEIVVDSPIGDIGVPYDKPGEWENPLNDVLP